VITGYAAISSADPQIAPVVLQQAIEAIAF
jgi:hypothetical protein